MARTLAHLSELQHVRGDGICGPRIQAQRAVDRTHQLGIRLRIAAGEQRHSMTAPDQLVGQRGHDALGAAVESRWNTTSRVSGAGLR